MAPPPLPGQASFKSDKKPNRGQAESTSSRRTDNFSERKQNVPRYVTCGKNHEIECRRKTGACLNCEQFGHYIIDCHNMRQQTTQTQISQPTVQMNRSEGRGNGGRGRGQGTYSANPQPPTGRGAGRVFALNQHDPQTSNTVSTGTLLVQDESTFVLFDSEGNPFIYIS